MRKIKLFGSHWEMRVFVTDEMAEDFKKCHKKIEDTNFREHEDCEHCSWKDTDLPCEWGTKLCGLYAVEDAIMEENNEQTN